MSHFRKGIKVFHMHLYESQCKGHPWHVSVGIEWSWTFSSNPFATLALEGDGWSALHPGRFTPGKHPVPIVQEVGWASGLVWNGVENVTSTCHGIYRKYKYNWRKQDLWMLHTRIPFQILCKTNISAHGPFKHWNKAIKNTGGRTTGKFGND